jgi:predicted house-cleaning noncanonical NTP pyrophosphatase (MazG superfamily)
MEVWKDINGYEGLYEISDLGNVKSHSFKNPKNLSQHLNAKGYLNVKLYKENKKQGFQVHRLVAIAFIPNPENKPEVNHKKGIKKDNRATELEWNTSSENKIHSVEVLNNISKRRVFNKKQIEYIRENTIQRKGGLNGNGNVKEICFKFNTNQSTIHNIITFKTYKKWLK